MNSTGFEVGERIRLLASSALDACRLLLAEAAQRASDVERTRRDALARIRVLTRSRDEISARVAFVERMIPFGAASSLVNRNAAARVRDAGRGIAAAKSALVAASKTADRIEAGSAGIRTLAIRLVRARDHAYPSLFSPRLEDAVEALERRSELLGRVRPKAARHADLCADILRIAARAAASDETAPSAPAALVRPSSLPPRESPTIQDLRDLRINLPIPRTLWGEAGRNGALRDPEASKGVSPFYILPTMDIRPFADLLPSALKGPQAFSFPPIHPNAPGQNLWTMFDDTTWSHIRNTSYGLSGHRCSICGGRGGYVADKLYPDGSRSGVDCHEIWEWTSPDVRDGVGIQTLRNLVVVCVSCHATFHENYFVRKADEIGEADGIRAHIRKRRHLMTRLDTATLERQLESERKELERFDGVTEWIVDLDHLARQQFMADRVPVFVERNAAGVPSSRIAGISFRTDRGEIRVRRVAAQVYAEAVGESRKPDPFRERSLHTTSAGAFGR